MNCVLFIFKKNQATCCFFIAILGVLFFASSLAAFDLNESIDEKVKAIAGEYELFPTSKVRAIFEYVAAIQKREVAAPIQSFHSAGIEGSFYRIVSPKCVLYLPPETSRFMLGKGSHKTVYKALFFIDDGVEVVAAALADDTVMQEAAYFQNLSSHWSTEPFRAFFSLAANRHILVLKYFNMGSLFSMQKRGIRLELREKLVVAKESVAALLTMHGEGFAHRDLHNGNVMVHKTKTGDLQVGLIDLARCAAVGSVHTHKVQGAISRNPPEVLLLPVAQVNMESADIYALGCCLYSFFFRRQYPGSRLYDIRDFPKLSQKEKNALYEKVRREYILQCESVDAFLKTQKKNQSKRKDKKAYKMELFQKTLLKMLHPDPEKRILLPKVLEALDAALE